jgi:hypothetical protein
MVLTMDEIDRAISCYRFLDKAQAKLFDEKWKVQIRSIMTDIESSIHG